MNRLRWLAVSLMLVIVAVPAALLAQTSAPPAPTGLAALLTTYAIPIATFGGSAIVWGLSHLLPAFNAISMNADGTPSFIGTVAKYGSVIVASYLVILGDRVLGGTAPPDLQASVGAAWASILQALGAAVPAIGVFKLATTSPSK